MKTLGLINPTNDIPTYSNSVGVANMAAATGQAFDTPADAHYVSLSGDAPFWVRFGSTAASIPSTSSTATSTNSIYVPTAAMPFERNIGSTATTTGFSLISATTAIISLQFYT